MKNEKGISNPILVFTKQIIGGKKVFCPEEHKNVFILRCLECGKSNLIIDLDTENNDLYRRAMDNNSVVFSVIAKQYDHIMVGYNTSPTFNNCLCGSEKTIRQEFPRDLDLKRRVKGLPVGGFLGIFSVGEQEDNIQNNKQGFEGVCENHHFILNPSQEEMHGLKM